jgi:hypothetical protein
VNVVDDVHVAGWVVLLGAYNGGSGGIIFMVCDRVVRLGVRFQLDRG